MHKHTQFLFFSVADFLISCRKAPGILRCFLLKISVSYKLVNHRVYNYEVTRRPGGYFGPNDPRKIVLLNIQENSVVTSIIGPIKLLALSLFNQIRGLIAARRDLVFSHYAYINNISSAMAFTRAFDRSRDTAFSLPFFSAQE